MTMKINVSCEAHDDRATEVVTLDRIWDETAHKLSSKWRVTSRVRLKPGEMLSAHVWDTRRYLVEEVFALDPVKDCGQIIEGLA